MTYGVHMIPLPFIDPKYERLNSLTSKRLFSESHSLTGGNMTGALGAGGDGGLFLSVLGRGWLAWCCEETCCGVNYALHPLRRNNALIFSSTL